MSVLVESLPFCSYNQHDPRFAKDELFPAGGFRCAVAIGVCSSKDIVELEVLNLEAINLI